MAQSVPPFPYDRYNKEVWDSHNPDALANYVAPDARVHSMAPGEVAGPRYNERLMGFIDR